MLPQPHVVTSRKRATNYENILDILKLSPHAASPRMQFLDASAPNRGENIEVSKVFKASKKSFLQDLYTVPESNYHTN